MQHNASYVLDSVTVRPARSTALWLIQFLEIFNGWRHSAEIHAAEDGLHVTGNKRTATIVICCKSEDTAFVCVHFPTVVDLCCFLGSLMNEQQTRREQGMPRHIPTPLF